MGGQDFVRAHGEEQKAVRVNQIVEAALALYDEEGYDRITFSKLAKGLGFSRINLYNYFRTKEELFLEIVRRAYEGLLEDVLASIPDSRMDREAYVAAWTAVATRHPRAFELFVLMNMQVLRGVSDEERMDFQHYLDEMVSKVSARISVALALSNEEAWTLVAHQLNYAMGLFPIVTRTYGETAARDESFSAHYAQFLATMLAGMGI